MQQFSSFQWGAKNCDGLRKRQAPFSKCAKLTMNCAYILLVTAVIPILGISARCLQNESLGKRLAP